MKRFEIGQRIDKGGVVFEITGRTKKTVKFVEIQHAGRFNERRSEEKKEKDLRMAGKRNLLRIAL